MRNAVILVTALLGVGSAGCGAGTPSGTYVGPIEGTDAWAAVTVDATRAVAFVSGGEQTLASHTRWMEAPVDADVVTLSADGWQLDLFINDLWVSGDLVSPDGSTSPFKLDLVDDSSVSGLYTAVDSGCRDGLIVRGSSEEDFAAIGAWCDDQGNIAPAVPEAFLVDGVRVRADAPGLGERVFIAAEAHPSLQLLDQ